MYVFSIFYTIYTKLIFSNDVNFMDDEDEFVILDNISEVASNVNEIEIENEIEIDEEEINEDNESIDMDIIEEEFQFSPLIPVIGELDLDFINDDILDSFSVNQERTVVRAVSQFGVYLGHYYVGDIFDHEKINIDLTNYGFPLRIQSQNSVLTNEQKTNLFMHKIVAWIYKETTSVAVFTPIRYQLMRDRQSNSVNCIHSNTQTVKSNVTAMLAILFTTAFGTATFISVKNNDSVTSKNQFKQKFVLSNSSNITFNENIPMDFIRALLIKLRSQIRARRELIPPQEYDILRSALLNVKNIFKSLLVVEKAEIELMCRGRRNLVIRPMIALLNNNHTFSKIITKARDIFFNDVFKGTTFFFKEF